MHVANGPGRASRIAVVGGGISGLAAARRLRQSTPRVEVVVIERERRLGGKLLTEPVDGFVLEGAPDSFLSSKPRGIGLARELGIDGHLQGVRQETRRTFVMREGRLVQLPEGLSGLVPTRLGPLFRSPLLSPWGKARAAIEPVIPARPADGDESLGSFMRRRMGSEAYTRLIEPLMSGIYGGNGDELSLEATFPRLRRLELEHGSLLRGLRASASAPRGDGPPPSPFLAPAGGMGELIESLVGGLSDVQLCTETEAVALQRHGDRYVVSLSTGAAVEVDAAILATPAYSSAELVSELDTPLAGLLSSIPYASTATVSLGYQLSSLPKPLDGHGYIIPRREGRPVLACTWTSSKFLHRAPEGHALVRGFLGRAGDEQVLMSSDEGLVSRFRDELRETLGISDEPSLTRVFRWPRAMPQYRVGHLTLLERIDARLRDLPGIFLAGAAYRGVGIPDCIESGERAADLALTLLTQAPR